MDVTVGDRLKRRREELQLTQRQLGLRLAAAARDLGEPIAPPATSTISCWETGKRIPSPLHALLLGHALQVEPEALGLERVLSPDRTGGLTPRAGAQRLAVLTGRPPGRGFSNPAFGQDREPAGPAGWSTEGVDWERLSSTLLTIRRVDGRVVEDQWALTRHYLDELRTLTTPSHVQVITGHLWRLQRLRHLADGDAFRQELGIMICQSAMSAGVSWQSGTDYGLAMKAYEYCAVLAEELNEPALRSAGLIMQAQLYGGQLQSRLPRVVGRQQRLMDEAERSSRGFWPEARQLVGSIASLLHTEFGHEHEARRALEQARRAQVDRSQDAGPYLGMVDSLYLEAVEATVESRLGRQGRAIALLNDVIAGTDVAWGWRGHLAWAVLTLGSCYSAGGAVELAAPKALEAWRLAGDHECLSLKRAAEAFAERLVAAAPGLPAVQALRIELRIA